MRNSDENRHAYQPQIIVTDLEKRRFRVKYENHSGIKMWGFHSDLNMWVVKRNHGKLKYYKDTHDFSSWTKVHLTKLSATPFHNPSKDPNASNFKLFLERQVKEKFSEMKTADLLIRRDKEVLDPRTNERMNIMMWHATKHLKEIPIPQHFHEGYLDHMEFWAFDEVTATTAIKFTDSDIVLHLVDAKDLLQFRERDIHTLNQHQIIYKGC
ncbi:unnamed protein product [Lactuca saligna]|uniref:Uncharacterized protein n=1 Tax=Lactuca saligna TaxID=75948 RepID=A0AA35UZU0_LACSI|nr:unnamed protein product [Lactuca saligna]